MKRHWTNVTTKIVRLFRLVTSDILQFYLFCKKQSRYYLKNWLSSIEREWPYLQLYFSVYHPRHHE